MQEWTHLVLRKRFCSYRRRPELGTKKIISKFHTLFLSLAQENLNLKVCLEMSNYHLLIPGHIFSKHQFYFGRIVVITICGSVSQRWPPIVRLRQWGSYKNTLQLEDSSNSKIFKLIRFASCIRIISGRVHAPCDQVVGNGFNPTSCWTFFSYISFSIFIFN